MTARNGWWDYHPTIEQLADSQGVKPMTEAALNALGGLLDDNEVDDFIQEMHRDPGPA
jgi:hypothetical protein